VHLPPVPKAAVDARRFVRRLDLPVSADAVASAELMVTELVTNVVLHARTHAVVGVAVTAESVLVTVQDEDAAHPEQQPYGASLAQQGRGLHIVETLADRWGVSAYDGGKVVWFTVPRTSEPAADPEGGRA
jgi:anti-sigma regulatory factor (Ser/Thr protein kinase)